MATCERCGSEKLTERPCLRCGSLRNAKIGKYLVDYSPLTPEELAAPTGCEKLIANSKPINRRS